MGVRERRRSIVQGRLDPTGSPEVGSSATKSLIIIPLSLICVDWDIKTGLYFGGGALCFRGLFWLSLKTFTIFSCSQVQIFCVPPVFPSNAHTILPKMDDFLLKTAISADSFALNGTIGGFTLGGSKYQTPGGRGGFKSGGDEFVSIQQFCEKQTKQIR